jgi:hypothetical protein
MPEGLAHRLAALVHKVVAEGWALARFALAGAEKPGPPAYPSNSGIRYKPVGPHGRIADKST